MKICAIIVAAGSSSRMKMDVPKVLIKINNKTVIKRTLEVFEKTDIIDEIVLVTKEEDYDEILLETTGIDKIKAVVIGGNNRQDSVLNGVKAVGECDLIAIHDGARPLVKSEDIHNVCMMALEKKAASLAVKAKDTIKQTDENNIVINTPDRNFLWQVQTPQVFDYSLYLQAIRQSEIDGISYTDDCQLVEKVGAKVYMCEGSYENIKITTKEDINALKSFICKEDEPMFKIGQGYDVHKLVSDRDLILGGVKIPHDKGLLGHSDADVLLHAITDALLGAAAMGDIGLLFPDNNDKYKNANSLDLLKIVIKEISKKGYMVNNIDVTVVAQMPKLRPFIDEMRKNVAYACNTDIDNINIKATTEEKLGFTGRMEGISAHSVCLIQKNG